MVAIEFHPRRCAPDPPFYGTDRSGRLIAPARSELPGIALVDVFGEQAGPPGERRPVGVLADHRPEIRHLHFQAALVVHLVGLDDALVRVLSAHTMPASTALVTCRPVAF